MERRDRDRGPVVLSLPFAGQWLVRNSPSRRVPSHGSDLFGERYAVDFIGVHRGRRTALRNDWRTALATEPPERFVAFGRPLLAPASGTVVAVHDGEVDHEARRSQLALVPYALTQASRVRQGVAAIAGNHVVIELEGGAGFAALVHLQRGSVVVRPGDGVVVGQPVGACGNSGNSTQPHLHLQVADGPDMSVAQGVPFVFDQFRERPRPSAPAVLRRDAVPAEGAVIEP